MDGMEVYIGEDGEIQGIYSDDLAEVFEGDAQETRRASHVEPHPKGGWLADMRPVGGPVLFADGVGLVQTDPHRTPFATRREALAAETAWIRARLAEGALRFTRE